MKRILLLVLPLWLTAFVCGQNFSATPLIDFRPGELYLNTFSGSLYEGSDSMPADHDADGRNAASRVQALDAQGHPSPFGKIVVVAIGMSNWTDEMCDSRTRCISQSFLGTSQKDPQVNHRTLIIV